MKHHIEAATNTLLVCDDSMLIENFGSQIEITTYGPRGGIRGFIILDKIEFVNLWRDVWAALAATETGGLTGE